jgi:hypothetical protein
MSLVGALYIVAYREGEQKLKNFSQKKEDELMTNKKEIYHLLNEIDFDTNSYEKKELSEIEKEKLFQSVKNDIKPIEKFPVKRSSLFVIATILFISLIGSQTQFGQKVQATANSIIENIRYSLSQALGNEQANTSESAISFNQTASIGDTQVSIGEMIAFEHRIVFNLLVDLAEPIQEQNFAGFSDYSIKINGDSIETYGLVGQGQVYDEEENIHSIIYSTDLSQFDFSEDEMTIDVMLEDIHVFNPNQTNDTQGSQPIIEGKAHFSADTNLSELTENTNVYKINHFVDAGNYQYQIETLYTHPLLNFIEVSSENWNDYQLVEIRGEDNQGQSVVFNPSSSLSTQETRKTSFSLNEELSEITSKELTEAESLQLQLYSAGWPEGEEAKYQTYGEPFIVELQ